MHLTHIVGARPNFPKLAPVYRAARARGLMQTIVHTGQHYDEALSESFLRDLDTPPPDINLAVGSASHAVQTARIMERLEPVLTSAAPGWVVVYGDVNSTIAAAMVAAKMGIRIAHVEAGLRSGDRTMPEEINRIVTDRLADLLLTPSRDADETLRREGEPDHEICFVGNVMIDSLFAAIERTRLPEFVPAIIPESGTVLVTLHRPSNVDAPDRLEGIIRVLRDVAKRRRVVFPMHPRTRARLCDNGIDIGKILVLPPVPYMGMVGLLCETSAVITDSGGLQEESTALGIPCFTVRPNTERPITLTEGTNRLVPDPEHLPCLVEEAIQIGRVPGRRPEGWDGHAAQRVVEALVQRAQ